MNVKDIKNLKNIEAFNGNFAVLRTNENKVGLINRSGEVVFEPAQYQYVAELKDGLFVFSDFLTDEHMTFDAKTRTRLTDTQILLLDQEKYIYKKNGLFGVCDRNFQPLTNPIYQLLQKWQDRLLGRKDGKWEIINAVGEKMAPYAYDDCPVIADNLCEYDHRAVSVDGKYFWIDINGNRVSRQTYEYLQPRNSKGYAIMKQAGRLGIIDAQENVLCLTDYSEFDDSGITYSRFYWCTPEHIAFYEDGLFGIMDVHGNIIMKPQFRKVDFQAKDYLIKITAENGKQGLITADGRVVIPAEYDWLIRRRKSGRVKGRKDGKWSVMNEQGEILIPADYESISFCGDKGLEEMAVKKGGECFFINEKQERTDLF